MLTAKAIGLFQRSAGLKIILNRPIQQGRRLYSDIRTLGGLDFKSIETKWEKQWKQKTVTNLKNKDKFYVLAMFPYPSGNLHMGHVRVYTISDTIARFRRMLGHDVIHPMGWDAFGLPAENAALERNITPQDWTRTNISTMKKQFDILHTSIDWEREVNTSQPEYYKWTQHILLDLFDEGLLYQKEAEVNWDPIDKTVLANEQVDSNGCSWRSGAKVEKKSLTQWYIRITDYAESLLKDLESLDGWPEHVKTMQANWIGKSTGFTFKFPLSDGGKDELLVFTSRPETISGVTYLAVSPKHSLISKAPSTHTNAVQSYLDGLKDTDRGPSGIALGIDAINPVTGAKIPIYIANYVLGDYGSGAVMGVPAHDERDHAFALSQPELQEKQPFLQVVGEAEGKPELSAPFTGHGVILNGPLAGLDSRKAAEKIMANAVDQKQGFNTTQYRLRDWLISRQRYWGTPLPFIHCPDCGVVPVPRSDLPILLPETVRLAGHEGAPLASDPNFVDTACPSCGKASKRDTDTADTFVDSSWYYLRFLDPNNSSEIVRSDAVKNGMPVDVYIGGVEHAILHLLYSRFLYKFICKGDSSSWDLKEPFKRLLTQGMVQGKTFKDATTGQFIRPDVVELDSSGAPHHKKSGEKLAVSFEKMSKSKYNGVDPKATIDKFGVDATRLYTLFKAPPEESLDWDDQSIVGMQRFLLKVHRLSTLEYNSYDLPSISCMTPNDRSLYRFIHQTIQEVTKCLVKDFKLNVAVGLLIKLANRLITELSTPSSVHRHGTLALIKMLAPMAPSSAEEFWATLSCGPASVLAQSWPDLHVQALEEDVLECVVQVNGKKRFTMKVAASSESETPDDLRARVQSAALIAPEAHRYLPIEDPTKIKRIIVLNSGKLANFVVVK